MLIKKISVFLFCAYALAFLGQRALANIPESHHFVDTQKKLDLFTGITGWDFFTGDALASNSGDLQLVFVARSSKTIQNSSQPTLTMCIDKTEARTSRAYAEKWLKEYPKFGYELEMSQEASYGVLEGFEIDLKSTSSDRHIRQFLVKRDGEMWVFTCSSDQNHFSGVIKDCEKILKSAKTTL